MRWRRCGCGGEGWSGKGVWVIELWVCHCGSFAAEERIVMFVEWVSLKRFFMVELDARVQRGLGWRRVRGGAWGHVAIRRVGRGFAGGYFFDRSGNGDFLRVCATGLRVRA